MLSVTGWGLAVAAFCGIVIGLLACAVFLAPRLRARTGHDLSLSEPLEAEVLRRSHTGYVVLDSDGVPELSNQRATELGVLNAGFLDERIAEAAGQVAISGEPVDVELRPPPAAPSLTPRSVPAVIHAVVSAMDHDRVLIAASDESVARRAEEVRRDFVANVSHELKTPVSAMGLLAEAVVDVADDPESVRRFAGKLQAEATRLGSLVNELIALSRLQGATPLLDLAVVEIDSVVDETVARVATRAEAAEITITTDRPSGLLVRGDRTLLITALTNLVENAINHSPPGTPVSISRSLRAGEVQISVTDRGIGIAPEHQERVFERFFRIDAARSRATGGTGLGLAIVKHVAANHGGTATLWSRPGTGSTFGLRLPVLESAARSGHPDARGRASGENPQPAHGPRPETAQRGA